MILTFSRWLDALPLTPAQSWLVTTVVLVLTLAVAVLVMRAYHWLFEAVLVRWERRGLDHFIAQNKREAAEDAERRRLDALSAIGSAARQGGKR